MKKLTKLIILYLLTALILSGCAHKHSFKDFSMVATKIDIVTQYDDTLIHRHYNDPEKMEAVLMYLRLLRPANKPQDPPQHLSDDVYLITVHLSNGQKRYYRQAAHRYFSEGNRPWFSIDSGQAVGLYTLMRQYPSDPYTNPTKGVFSGGGFL